MTEEELAELRRKYVGKLVRMVYGGIPQNDMIAVVTDVRPYLWGTRSGESAPALITARSASGWYFGHDRWEVQIYGEEL